MLPKSNISSPPRPPWPVVGFALLAGPVLHGALLLAPEVIFGRSRQDLADPAVLLFLGLATAFYFADMPTLSHAHQPALRHASADDAKARREGLAAGLFLLATLWTALFTRSATSGWSFFVGPALMVAGVAIRSTAVWTLGRAFITEARSERGTLVISGIYRWIRHPSETGNLAFVFGACLLLESRAALIVAIAGVLPLTLWRLRREERCLADVHGPRFHAYAGRVKRLIPWIC